jgi:cytochrome c-type biogenesis protein
MPRFGAKMGQINGGHLVAGQQAQNWPRRQACQNLARAQHGQGAQKAKAIYFNIPVHRRTSLTFKTHASVTMAQVTRDNFCAIQGQKGIRMFGIDILDASLLPSLLVALLAGGLSFLSPCVLPIVPPYLAYMSGISVGDMQSGRRPIVAALYFVLGLSTVFMILGLAASALGGFFLGNAGWFNTAAALVIMVFGAHFLGIFRLSFLDRDLRLDPGARGGSAFGAYILGLAFAFGWTPCIGPQLGAILTLAAQTGEAARGITLLAAYALGLGIPFLAVAAFFNRMSPLVNVLKRHGARIERIMGLLLWTIGLLMLTGGFSALSFWLLDTIPFLANLG